MDKVYVLTDGGPNAEILAAKAMSADELESANISAKRATDGNLSWSEYRGPVVPRDEETDAVLLTIAEHPDRQGRYWYALERGDGSISLYYTHPDARGGVYAVWDSQPQPAPSGAVTFMQVQDKRDSVKDFYLCDQGGNHSGPYFPAETVERLRAALTEIRDKRHSKSFTAEQAAEIARATLAELDGAK